MRPGRPYLESRSAAVPPHSHVPTAVIHTRRVKGAYAGRGTPEYLYPLRPPSCRLRPSSFGADERGSLSPDRPPMGVVPSSNRDYGLRRGRCSPRAPRTRILYLPEKSRARLGAHVCAPTVCPERIGSLPPRQLERTIALLARAMSNKRARKGMRSGGMSRMLWISQVSASREISESFSTPRSLRDMHLEGRGTIDRRKPRLSANAGDSCGRGESLRLFARRIFSRLTDFRAGCTGRGNVRSSFM